MAVLLNCSLVWAGFARVSLSGAERDSLYKKSFGAVSRPKKVRGESGSLRFAGWVEKVRGEKWLPRDCAPCCPGLFLRPLLGFLGLRALCLAHSLRPFRLEARATIRNGGICSRFDLLLSDATDQAGGESQLLPRPAVAPHCCSGSLNTNRNGGAMRALLFHLDGKLPNLALMRLSAHIKAHDGTVLFRRTGQPERTLWEQDTPEAVYASAIFTHSRPAVDQLMSAYPSAVVGGTGLRVNSSLAEIGISSAGPLDYSLYPDFKSSIGFTQRGCRLRCSFCVVPEKEGASGNRQPFTISGAAILIRANYYFSTTTSSASRAGASPSRKSEKGGSGSASARVLMSDASPMKPPRRLRRLITAMTV